MTNLTGNITPAHRKSAGAILVIYVRFPEIF